MNKKITCRPCKERPGIWEIQDQYGQVQNRHYASKGECITKATEMACECGCELCISDEE